jgi:hypothetical protein
MAHENGADWNIILRKEAHAPARAKVGGEPVRGPHQLRSTAKTARVHVGCKKLWQDTVNALRADWFQGAEPVLEVYVETIELSRWLWEMIATVDRESDDFAELVKLHCQVSAVIGNLATKLRVTPQSSRDARIPKLVPVGPKPWDSARDSDPSPPDWQ